MSNQMLALIYKFAVFYASLIANGSLTNLMICYFH